MTLMHPTEYRFRHRNADGDVIWDQDWTQNALADEGEQDILTVYFRASTAPTQFYLALCNDTLAETDGLTDVLNEPSTNGYARQLVERSGTGWPTSETNAGDWSVKTGTETFSASGGSWGPVDTLYLATTIDNTGLLIAYVALSASRTLNDGDSLDVDLRLTLA